MTIRFPLNSHITQVGISASFHSKYITSIRNQILIPIHSFIFFFQWILPYKWHLWLLTKTIGLRILTPVPWTWHGLAGAVLVDTQLSAPLWVLAVLCLPPFTASRMPLWSVTKLLDFYQFKVCPNLCWELNYSSSIRKTQIWLKAILLAAQHGFIISYSGICSYFTNSTIPYIANKTIKPYSFLSSRLCWYLKIGYCPPCQAPEKQLMLAWIA